MQFLKCFKRDSLFMGVSTFALGIVIADSAYANRARVSAMGTGEGFALFSNGNTSAYSSGSFFYDDDYNMFHNPARVNRAQKAIFLEKGFADGTNTVNPYGGIVTEGWGLNWGVFVNRSDALPSSATAANNHPMDIIVGMESGEWSYGLGLTYAQVTENNTGGQEPSFSARALDLKLGAMGMGFEGFLDYQVLGAIRTSYNTTDRKDGKASNISLGLLYNLGAYRPFLAYRNASVRTENPAANADGTVTPKIATWGAGVSRSFEVSSRARIHSSLGYWTTSTSNNNGTETTTDGDRFLLASVAAEGNANSWLILRAGLAHYLVNQERNAPETAFGSVSTQPTLRVGAGYKGESFDLDWVLGVSNGINADQSNIDSPNLGTSTGLFSNISLTVRI